MAKMKAGTSPRNMVWRISERAPMGEWVDLRAAAAAPAPAEMAEPRPEGWASSSFDLLTGSDVTEFSDTLPWEVEELFHRTTS